MLIMLYPYVKTFRKYQDYKTVKYDGVVPDGKLPPENEAVK